MRGPLPIAVAAALALAAASLTLPYMPVYDPWAWLVWGRELASLDLATDAGPSWKPLPVLIDAPLSLLGEAAPRAWLLIARAGWLLAPALAGLLAARLAGPGAGRWRLVAAVLAAASVMLAADSFTPPVRQFTGGLSEGLLVALVLAAVWSALEGRSRVALWLGVAASLLRPECWPFLALWAAWRAREERALLPHALLAAAVVPLAWFVPDLIAAGDPLEGSDTARQGGVELDEIPAVLGRALAAPLAAAWIGLVLLALGERRQEEDRALRVLLAGAAAWVALVAAMAVVGFAGLPRFLAPATAVFSVAGAVGVARAGAASLGRGREPTPLGAAVAVALIAAVVGFTERAGRVPGDVETIEAQTRSQEDLRELGERLGPERLLACGGVVRVTNLLAQTSLAWWLEEPIEAVSVRRHPAYGVVLTRRPQLIRRLRPYPRYSRIKTKSAGREGADGVLAEERADGPPRVLDREGGWVALELPCVSSSR